MITIKERLKVFQNVFINAITKPSSALGYKDHMENYYLGIFPPPKTKPCYRSFYIIKYSSAKQKLITTIWSEANYQILNMLDHNIESTRERGAIMNKSLFGSKLT